MEHSRQSKVYIFDRKELFLLFFFFLFMAVTAFVLGMKFGKNQADFFLGDHSTKKESSDKTEFKGTQEESADKKIEESDVFKDHLSSNDPNGHYTDATESSSDVSKNSSKDMDEETFKKLQSEFEKINIKDMADRGKEEVTSNAGSSVGALPEIASSAESPPLAEVAPVVEEKKEDPSFLKPDQSYIGKFTIQLGSYKTLPEAKNFAEGFLGRGYRPLIKEAELANKGTWYRVSLGVFESISAAKQYVSNEKSLFQSQQYVISEIK